MKKILTVLLSIVMCFSVPSVSVFAEESDLSGSEEEINEPADKETEEMESQEKEEEEDPKAGDLTQEKEPASSEETEIPEAEEEMDSGEPVNEESDPEERHTEEESEASAQEASGIDQERDSEVTGIIDAVSDYTDENFEWKLYSNGKAELIRYIGQGAVAEIPAEINGKTVSCIREYAFENNTGLTGVTIPAGVTKIDYRAFSGCTNLQRVDFHANVASIGNRAFEGCSKLTTVGGIDSDANIRLGFTGPLGRMFRENVNVYIEEDVWEFENGPHLGRHITSVSLPSNITALEASAFEGCLNLSEITIPDSVTSIGMFAFHYCHSLTQIRIPNSVESIGEGAFRYCDHLTGIHIPAGVTSIGSVDPFTLKYKLFEGCRNLVSLTVDPANPVYDSRENCNALIETAGNTMIAGISTSVIPASVTALHSEAFRECIGLQSIVIPATVKTMGMSVFESSGLRNVVIEDGITAIPDRTFSDCESLRTLDIPKSVTSVGYGAVSSWIPDLTITYHGSKSDWEAIRGTEAIDNVTIRYLEPDDPKPSPVDTRFEWKVYSNGTADLLRYIGNDSVVVIPSQIEGYSVTRICDSAFRDNIRITGVTIPAGITEIGAEAFCGCVNLRSLDINAENCAVEYGAFLGCEKLKTVGGKDSTANIRIGYSGILRRLFRTSVEKDEDGIWQFEGGSGLGMYLTSADVPEGITVLGSAVFSGCINLTRISLPESLITISPQAFYNCVKLAKIRIPDSVTAIGEEAFRDCESLTEFHLPANVSSLGTISPYVLRYHLFSGCKNLRSLTVDPANPVYDSRDNCNAIIETAENRLIQGIGTSFIPASVTEIYREAFFDCKELTSITIPGAAEKIGTGAFSGSGLKTVVIEEGNKELPDGAFVDCDELETIELPHSLTAVDRNSIAKKDGNYTILYHGTPEDWQEVFQYYALHQATMIYLIPVKGVTISEKEVTAALNSSIRLSAEVLPQDAANKNVSWTSSNPSVASVNNGNVTAVSPGTAVITVTTEDGGFTDTCTVRVAEVHITEQPEDVRVNIGETAHFHVAASGTGLTYQWQLSKDNGLTWADLNGRKFPSALTADFEIKAGTGNNNNLFRCVVTDAYKDSISSDSAKLTLGAPLEITSQPEDVTAAAGEYAQFHVTATGTGLKYQWQLSRDNGLNWVTLSGTKFPSALTADFEIKASRNNNENLFRCVVSDQYGQEVASNSAKLTLQSALEIISQPSDAIAAAGENAQFHVTATGEGLKYQWQLSRDNGLNWANLSRTKFPSAVTPDFEIKASANVDGYLFRCVVSDQYGQEVTSNSAKLTLQSALEIISQPSDAAAAAGENAQFHVTATGEGLKYQWQLSRDNGINWVTLNKTKFPSALTPDFEIKASVNVNGYLFRCIVSDASGQTVTSSFAKLTLQSALEITSQPSDATAAAGENAQFHVTAAGTGLKYQWQLSRDNGINWVTLNKTKFPSALTADFEIKASKSVNGYLFRCVVSDESGQTVTSNSAKLTVETSVPLEITSHPSDAVVMIGETAQFHVTATGTGLKYQWQLTRDNGLNWVNLNGTKFPSALTADFEIKGSKTNNGYLFRCVVSDALGKHAESNGAKLTVQ